MSGWMPFSSSTSMTPMWAKPRAAPPPSASAIRGGRVGLGAGTTSATTGADAGWGQAAGCSAMGRLTGFVPQADSSVAAASTSSAPAPRIVKNRVSIFLTSMIP